MTKSRETRAAPGDRAALYIRVSSEEQARHGQSLEAQHDALVEYAQRSGLKIVAEYPDEGYTARKSYKNRPQFMRMLHDVEAEQFDVILFIKLDRWFRNVADYYEIQRILDAHHVSWIATEEDYDTTTANGRLHLNIKLSIAQDEADRTSERIKFVFQNKLQRGEVVSGKVPYGYHIEKKKLVINEGQAVVVRDVFDQYVKNPSINALRRYCMEKHGLVYRSQTGMKQFLTHEQYVGRFHGVDGLAPQIVERDVFDRAQQFLAQRSHRQVRSDRVYLFTSLVFCAECGNRLSAHTVSGNYIYYRCTRYEKLQLCTHKHRTSERILEQWLLDNLIPEFEKYNQRVKQAAEIPVDQEGKDRAKITRKMEKLKDLYLNDLIERDVYEKEYTALRAELSSLLPREAPKKPVDLHALLELLPLYESLTRERKRAFWVKIIKRITITNDDAFFIEPFSP